MRKSFYFTILMTISLLMSAYTMAEIVGNNEEPSLDPHLNHAECLILEVAMNRALAEEDWMTVDTLTIVWDANCCCDTYGGQ